MICLYQLEIIEGLKHGGLLLEAGTFHLLHIEDWISLGSL